MRVFDMNENVGYNGPFSPSIVAFRSDVASIIPNLRRSDTRRQKQKKATDEALAALWLFHTIWRS